jgi:hypothetical protein
MSLMMIAMAMAMSAQAAQPAPGTMSPNLLPMEIRKAVNEVNALCKDSGGNPGRSSKLIRFIDLNGDGFTDFLMDLGYYQCDGAASAVGAGQSGAAVTIFLGGPGNTARKAYDAVTQEVEIDTQGAAPRVFIAVMGAECGQKNAANLPMSQVAVCSRPLKYNAVTQTFELGPLSERRAVSVQ